MTAFPDDRTRLGIEGASPLFSTPVAVGTPNVPDEDRVLDLLKGALQSKRLTNDGPLVRDLEERFSTATGARHAVAVANATLGLQILAVALGLKGSVIVPSFTFIATAHALSWVGLEPTFADVDPRTHNLDVDDVARRLTADTAAVLAVHLWGTPAPIEDLERLTASRGIPLLFDAAHALGATHHGKPIGTFGVAEVFSTHATKFVNSFEGGVITTDDPELAARLRRMRNFGFDERGISRGLGTNAKMSEASAAMGIASMEAMDQLVDRNRSNYEAYGDVLRGVHGVRLLEMDARERRNHQYVVLEVGGDEAGLTADELSTALAAENVVSKRYFATPCHQADPYQSGSDRPALPVTDRLSAEVLALPTGLAVTPEMARAVATRVTAILDRAPSVREAVRHADAAGGKGSA